MSRIFRSYALSLLVSTPVLGGPALAQTAPKSGLLPSVPAPASVSSASTASSYRLGAEDVINVTVLKRPEFSLQSVTIPSDGRVFMPVIGEVRMKDRTLADVDAEITRRFRSRLRRPEVTVFLVKSRPRPLYVTGRVRQGGIFEFRDGYRVTQALAAAGGLVADTAQGAVTVTRGNKTILDTLLAPIVRDPNSAQNIPLRAGDSLRFYDRNINVTISGSVVRPGPFSVAVGTSVLDLFSQAGGATPTAALSKTQVRRPGQGVIYIDLRRALSEGTAKTDLTLREGDAVVVPELRERVSVVGAVTKPGLFPLSDGAPLKLSEVLAQAGGVAKNAALSKATLRRANGETLSLDLYPLVVQGASDSIVLRADDTLVIPEQRGIAVLGEVNTKPAGPVFIQEGAKPRISDVLTLVGGLSERPEDTRITIQRDVPGGKPLSLEVDPVALLKFNDLSQNARVEDGDRISITATPRAKVSVAGLVVKPGEYEISEGDSIPEVIARAGGPTPDASLSRVSLSRRDGSVKIYDLVNAITTGSQKVDIPLRAGDLITLPKSTARVTVLGAVTRPGEVSLPENERATVGTALSLAGGTRSQAKTKEIVLFRSGEKGGKVIDVQSAKNGNLAVATPVFPGDYIVVPERTNDPNTLGRALQILGPLSILFR